MGWIERAFGRALIYGVVREGFYANRQARRRKTHVHVEHHGPIERLHPLNKEALVQFECAAGHRFTKAFEDRNPTERDLAGTRCPDCRAISRWLAIDFHIENEDGTEARP